MQLIGINFLFLAIAFSLEDHICDCLDALNWYLNAHYCGTTQKYANATLIANVPRIQKNELTEGGVRSLEGTHKAVRTTWIFTFSQGCSKLEK